MEIENYGDMLEREKEQAERILNEFFTAATEIQKICEAHDQCGPQCPLYDKGTCRATMAVIDTELRDPYEWRVSLE